MSLSETFDKDVITKPPPSLDINSTHLINSRKSEPESTISNDKPNNISINNSTESKDTLGSISKNSVLTHNTVASKVNNWWHEFWGKKKDNISSEPTLLDKYDMIKRKVGKGTTGLIQLVKKKEGLTNNNKLAVKVFYRDRMTKEEIDVRVGQEYCINSGLNHRNIVQVYELIKNEQDDWCQVMEYCQGGDMRHIIQNGFLNPPEVNCCFRQLIEGISYIHSMGIAHRDIKPENLLIDDNCVLKIADFGCAEAFYDTWDYPCNTAIGLCGSEPYISPEILKQYYYGITDKNDARLVDIWACAIVYLVMTHGQLPFLIADESKDKNYANYLAYRQSSVKFPFLQELNKSARDLLLRMLDPTAKHRADMKHIIEDSFFKSIEVCIKGQARSCSHHHFSQDIF